MNRTRKGWKTAVASLVALLLVPLALVETCIPSGEVHAEFQGVRPEGVRAGGTPGERPGPSMGLPSPRHFGSLQADLLRVQGKNRLRLTTSREVYLQASLRPDRIDNPTFLFTDTHPGESGPPHSAPPLRL